MKKIDLFFLFGVCVVGAYWYHAHYAAPPAIKDKATLIIGTSDDYQPYSFTKDGVTMGLDIDMAYEIARRMELEPILKIMSFDVLLVALDKGAIDLIAAGFSPTAQRAQRCFFTEEHAAGDPFVVVSLKDQPRVQSVDNLYGKKVVVNEGYAADFYLSQYAAIQLRRVETVAEGVLALQKKRADYFIAAESVIEPVFKLLTRDGFSTSILPGVTDHYALVLSKKNLEFFERVNAVVKAMIADGTVARFKQKWGIAS